MFDLSSVTQEDKEKCLPIVDLMVKYCDMARKKGVLALEEVALNHEDYFFKFVLMLVVDGTDPELVMKMAYILINSGNHQGSALFERVLTMEGISSIQTGDSPHLLRAKLLCYFGESYLQDAQVYTDGTIYAPNNRKLVDVAYDEPMEECIEFSKQILMLSDFNIQRVLSDVETWYIAVALKGCGKDVAEKVGANVSTNQQSIIANQLEDMGPIAIRDILETQLIIMKTIRHLVEQGAIILPEREFQILNETIPINWR